MHENPRGKSDFTNKVTFVVEFHDNDQKGQWTFDEVRKISKSGSNFCGIKNSGRTSRFPTSDLKTKNPLKTLVSEGLKYLGRDLNPYILTNTGF